MQRFFLTLIQCKFQHFQYCSQLGMTVSIDYCQDLCTKHVLYISLLTMKHENHNHGETFQGWTSRTWILMDFFKSKCDETYSYGSEYISMYIHTNSIDVRNHPVLRDSLCPQSSTLESWWRTGWFLLDMTATNLCENHKQQYYRLFGLKLLLTHPLFKYQ